MKPKTKTKLNSSVFTVFVLAIFWLILSSGKYSFFGPSAMIKIQTALANSSYGILGQTAPEINLNTWIDGNGKAIQPIRLNDYRGKVVYLYFFQDW